MYVLKPIIHKTIWGGNKLKNYGGPDENKTGHLYSVYSREEISNEIINWPHKGKTLNSIYPAFKEYFQMEQYRFFPLTVALVDAREHLSIQVHPDDQAAALLENERCGKRESWYFLEKPDSEWIYNGCTCNEKKEVIARAGRNELESVTGRLSVSEGDYVYVAPGTLHALTAGSLVYEIEEGTDYTYRFFDFGRKDENGEERKLHIDRALKAIKPELKSEVKRYEDYDGCINEEHYFTRKYTNISSFINRGDSIACFTLIKGEACVDDVRMHSGMTALVLPGESIDNLMCEMAIVSGMR